ncbi:MAG: hypothetical protein GKR94_00615 [Gammaproteobacteria bacterium]|nr:hypothetical protein [Gammaproteobacteria bacterium]
MVKYQLYDSRQMAMVPVDFGEQIVPGTFESMLGYRAGHHLDFSTLDARLGYDEIGARRRMSGGWCSWPGPVNQ